MIPVLEGLQRLRDGNQRFAEGADSAALTSASRRAALKSGQQPFAIVLGCSDSRVPAEIIFDQGLGDLFVIRVAGNIVAPSQINSVEFAVQRFGTPLAVVLGHSGCGAVEATLEELTEAEPDGSPRLPSIVERIRPAVEPLLATELREDPEALMRQAVRANISASAENLRHGPGVLEKLVRAGALAVVGAEYSLDTGLVDFFDGAPNGV